MKAQFRFWRADKKNGSFLGKIWVTIPGIKDLSGTVLDGQDGIYPDFRNSPKMIAEDGKVTYGKPAVVIDEELHQLATSAVDTFWGSNVKSVTLEMVADGHISVVKDKVTAAETIIDGAQALIDKANRLRGQKTAVQDEPPANADEAIEHV